MEDVDADDWLVADPEPYLFEPEYTEEELAQMDREREETQEDEAAGGTMRTRANSTWWCQCNYCAQMSTEEESFCCTEWDQVLPPVQLEDTTQCIAATDAFAAMIHPSVVDFFFRRDKINWKKRHTPSGPDGQLSSE